MQSCKHAPACAPAYASCDSCASPPLTPARRRLKAAAGLPKCRGYTLTESIGCGSFGEVFAAVCDGGSRVALKIAHEQQFSDLNSEEEILRDVRGSEWVVRLVGKGWSEGGRPFLALECLGGSLQELCTSGQPLGTVRTIVRQLLHALLFLDERGIVHRDLKPNNVLFTLVPRFDAMCSVKLIDFGMSIRTSDMKLCSRKVQTQGYRSPEVALGLEYGTAIDMWSVGCVVAEMATGHNVWAQDTDLDALHRIHRTLEPIPDHMRLASPHHRFQECVLPQSEECPSALPASPPDLHSMLHSMLRVDPAKRGTPKQLLEHEFVTGAEDDARVVVPVAGAAAAPPAGGGESDATEKTPLKETPCASDVASEQSDADPLVFSLTPGHCP